MRRRVRDFHAGEDSYDIDQARTHPRAARNVAAGGMVAVAGVGAFHAYSPLLAVVVLSPIRPPQSQ
jgi:hypothetical protein